MSLQPGPGHIHFPYSPHPQHPLPLSKCGSKEKSSEEPDSYDGVCVPQLCFFACHAGNSLRRSRKEKKNVQQKSMDCIWCPLKLINRQKMKGRAYTCELLSARALASRGSTSGCFLFLWPSLGPHPWGKSFTEQLGERRGGEAVRRREQGNLRVCLALVLMENALAREIFEWLQTLWKTWGIWKVRF